MLNFDFISALKIIQMFLIFILDYKATISSPVEQYKILVIVFPSKKVKKFLALLVILLSFS